MNVSHIRSMLGYELFNANVALEVAKAHADLADLGIQARNALGLEITDAVLNDSDRLVDTVFDAELLVERLTERVEDMDQCYWPHRFDYVEDPLTIKELA